MSLTSVQTTGLSQTLEKLKLAAEFFESAQKINSDEEFVSVDFAISKMVTEHIEQACEIVCSLSHSADEHLSSLLDRIESALSYSMASIHLQGGNAVTIHKGRCSSALSQLTNRSRDIECVLGV